MRWRTGAPERGNESQMRAYAGEESGGGQQPDGCQGRFCQRYPVELDAPGLGKWYLSALARLTGKGRESEPQCLIPSLIHLQGNPVRMDGVGLPVAGTEQTLSGKGVVLATRRWPHRHAPNDPALFDISYHYTPKEPISYGPEWAVEQHPTETRSLSVNYPLFSNAIFSKKYGEKPIGRGDLAAAHQVEP